MFFPPTQQKSNNDNSFSNNYNHSQDYEDSYDNSSNSIGFLENLENYWDIAMSNKRPSGDAILGRFMFAMPVFTIGGFLGGAINAHVTNLSGSKFTGMVGAGGDLGLTFIAINTATTIACKILGIKLEQESKELLLKNIIDVALAALITFTFHLFTSSPIALQSFVTLIPCALFGALVTFGASQLFQLYVENIKAINRGLDEGIGSLLDGRF